jgi:hypothetical protein
LVVAAAACMQLSCNLCSDHFAEAALVRSMDVCFLSN